MFTEFGKRLGRSRAWRPSPRLASVLHAILRMLDAVGFVPFRRTTYLGHRFVYPLDSLIGAAIAEGGEWDRSLVEIVRKALPMEAPVICEVGSNIGASLVQLKRAKPKGRVIAFEPSDRFRPFLQKNVGLAGLEGVTVSSALLGRRKGTVSLYNNAASASTARPRDPRDLSPRRRQQASMTTLDAALGTDTKVDFIKVDTDGFDFEVLRGAEATIRRDWPILYFEYFPGLLTSPESDLAWLQVLGYRTFFCYTPSGEFSGQTTDVAEATLRARLLGYCDVLTCPQDSLCEQLFRTRYS
jgi:FkbM family methyltransferase